MWEHQILGLNAAQFSLSESNSSIRMLCFFQNQKVETGNWLFVQKLQKELK